MGAVLEGGLKKRVDKGLHTEFGEEEEQLVAVLRGEEAEDVRGE